jgi:hypothetical protein
LRPWSIPNRKKATTTERSVKTLRAGRRHKPAQISGKYFTRPSLDAGEARRKAHLPI